MAPRPGSAVHVCVGAAAAVRVPGGLAGPEVCRHAHPVRLAQGSDQAPPTRVQAALIAARHGPLKQAEMFPRASPSSWAPVSAGVPYVRPKAALLPPTWPRDAGSLGTAGLHPSRRGTSAWASTRDVRACCPRLALAGQAQVTLGSCPHLRLLPVPGARPPPSKGVTAPAPVPTEVCSCCWRV